MDLPSPSGETPTAKKRDGPHVGVGSLCAVRWSPPLTAVWGAEAPGLGLPKLKCAANPTVWRAAAERSPPPPPSTPCFTAVCGPRETRS